MRLDGDSGRGEVFLARCLVATLVILQFLNVPLLGDVHYAGKAYFLACVMLPVAFCYFRPGRVICASRWLGLFALVWLVLALGTWFAFSRLTAFLVLCQFTLLLLLLLLSLDFCRRQRGFSLLLQDGMLFAGLVAAALGFVQFFYYKVVGPCFTMTIPYLLPPTRNIRVAGVYGQPNLFALLLVLTILLFFFRYLQVDAGSPRGRLRPWRFLPLLLTLVVFFQTGSKAGLLALVCSLGLLLYLYYRGRLMPAVGVGRWELPKMLCCIPVAFAVYLLLANLSFSAVSVGGGGGAAAAGAYVYPTMSADVRLVLWTAGTLVFLDHPLFGIGLNNFRYVLPEYLNPTHTLLGFVDYAALQTTDWVHNELLSTLAEGGLVATAPLLLLLVAFAVALARLVFSSHGAKEPLFVYGHLYIIPFLVQGLLSWPLRYLPLAALFFSLVGLLLSGYPLRLRILSRPLSVVARLGLLAGMVLTLMFLREEVAIGKFKRAFLAATAPESLLGEFSRLADGAYSQYAVLSNALPVYVRYAVDVERDALAVQLIPHAETVVRLQGGYDQWYNLALLYGQSGRLREAEEAVGRAIELQPEFQPAWQYQHHLNILKASRATGRPVADFIPPEVDAAAVMQEFVNEGNRPLKRQ